ncbi:MAG: dihydrolipoyllysine-residue acetyltransferase [Gammaproteobacteria bacterium]|nr:dihydrolipoyllysine-residue acetyltransferase [Gammaproteobacteria bacterium]MBL6998452.1 dihydrolipoyllysine-residue acetyltransferase [Gammaproteobacteria bacterium]
MANIEKILLPDVGDFDDIEIIEVIISAGDDVNKDDSIIMLESDKATMEIPSPVSGKIQSVAVKVGDRISEGTLIAEIETSESQPPVPAPAAAAKQVASAVAAVEVAPVAAQVASAASQNLERASSPVSDLADSALTPIAHASPSIRRFARELGVDISRVNGSGNKGRVLKEDVQGYVKSTLASAGTAAAPGRGSGGMGLQISQAPVIDFSKFGETETQVLSRIKKISGAHLHRSWVSVPHVTQFDEADITGLEEFRKSLAKEAEKKGVRLTPLVFIMKAVVCALQEIPEFNSSLDASGDNLILKKYFHIGVAVDTPNGLMVPVIRDVDKKGIYQLSAELSAVAARARDGKLSPADMQGGCFSISSLGGIGGTQFTPIVNAPEVAILGVARAKMQPVYQSDGTFKPALMLPLALSYDHRVIDGAQGARFTNYLSQLISDIRRVLL